MDADEPLAQLPERITLALSDVTELLGALDLADELTAPGTREQRTIRRAIVLLTAKLWPELGDLLDTDDE